ncbi:3D domain-containing protein [Helicovermis profundi]|uniref:3D domain-containing protein n=1 Tax=Helicovermis profundi TaxID=3065157 RepID=A0AAU9EMM4_9FIRM|nr:3D domain-containing protein [Clostridia bacterium S502]
MRKKDIIILCIIILFSSLSVYTYSKFQVKDIVIIDNDKKIVLKTPLKRIDKILDIANIALNEKDKVIPSVDTKIDKNFEITIIRAKKIEIDYDGIEKEVFSTNNLAIDVLKEYSINIGEFDKVLPSKNIVVSDGDIIKIIRVEKKLVTEKKIVKYDTIIKMTTKLKSGQIKKISDGLDGLTNVTYNITTEDGKEVSRKIIKNEIVTESKAEIIEKGIDKLFVTSRGMPFRYKSVIIMRASAYDLSFASCGKYPDNPEYGITFSGTKAHPGVVAVDPKVIPLKSKLYVESLDRTKDYGFASAEDTGSAIKGNRIDLFIGDNKAAMRYGRRNVRVYVIDDNVTDELIKGYGK